MGKVTLKTESDVVDGTPEKRLFLSIISDYDLKTGLCELIDNALDLWVSGGKKAGLKILVQLDQRRQLISVFDNAGGVKEEDLRLLIAPGASRNNLGSTGIGIFGVGSKRAGVALGERVEIRTRYKKEKSLQIDITKEWLASDDWRLPTYEIPDVSPGTTLVEISNLRQTFDEDSITEIERHLGETYNWFLKKGCVIELNGKAVKAIDFDKWAYPPKYPPREATFKIKPSDAGEIDVSITAGLIRDRKVEQEDEYGVYFYCNNRLIVKELRTREVGYFITNEAGVPHPDASLCRVIVHMRGAAQLMPWNSSKSDLNYTHPAFKQIHPTLINLVAYFSKLSRRLKKNWEGQVFQFTKGTIESVPAGEISENRLVLPDLPRVRRARIDDLKVRNRRVLRDNPWTLGLVEAMGLVDLVVKQKLDTKNRSALILLDSNFEIGLKEFIVTRTDLFDPRSYSDARIAQIFKSRHAVISEVSQHVQALSRLLPKVDYYYQLRNKLIHERATVLITDAQIKDYRKTIERALGALFNLRFPRD